MATQLFLRVTGAHTTATRFQRDFGTHLTGSTPQQWGHRPLLTTRGGGSVNIAATTVAGPTAGLEFGKTSDPGIGSVWVSPPIDQDVTISGSITLNFWVLEANMADNCSINALVYRVDSVGALTLIAQTARTTEMGTTVAAANFTVTPTSTGFLKGDRIALVPYIDDATSNMGAGGSGNLHYDGTTGGADGDSFVTLTETFGFLTSDPATTTIYPTDTASDVATSSVDREAWTSRGAGVQTDVTTSVVGPTSPIHVTDTAGGTVVDWFTKKLAAFTLAAPVLVNIRGLQSAGTIDATFRVEIARVASDGTSATVWGANASNVELTTGETALVFYVSGDDLAISDQQRLRIRAYIDDAVEGTAMASGTVTLHYAGTSGGASGDTFLIFGQALTEATSGTNANAGVATGTGAAI